MKKLQLEKVSVRFGKVAALNDVSIELSSSETLLLAGPNGAGKSTLMRVLLGLVRPADGVLTVDGKPRSLRRGLKSELGYLPEAVAFSPALTGRQVLRFFAWARGVKRGRINDVLERIGLKQAAGRAVRGYSRGMRQRLGLGVAILAEPQLLILDEPTGGLDQEGLAVLWSVMLEWREQGRMVLIASHDLTLLERRVDRICLLSSGTIQIQGPPEHLREVAALPQRVTMQLNPRANGSAALLVDAFKEGGIGRVTREGLRLEVEVEHDQLLDLMDIRGQFPDVVQQLRVEEPQLDEIYEALLRRPS